MTYLLSQVDNGYESAVDALGDVVCRPIMGCAARTRLDQVQGYAVFSGVTDVQTQAQIFDWMGFAGTLRGRGHPVLSREYEWCGYQLALHHLKLNKPWAPMALRITLSYTHAPTREHRQRVCDLLAAARKRGMDAPAHPSCATLKKGRK